MTDSIEFNTMIENGPSAPDDSLDSIRHEAFGSGLPSLRESNPNPEASGDTSKASLSGLDTFVAAMKGRKVIDGNLNLPTGTTRLQTDRDSRGRTIAIDGKAAIDEQGMWRSVVVSGNWNNHEAAKNGKPVEARILGNNPLELMEHAQEVAWDSSPGGSRRTAGDKARIAFNQAIAAGDQLDRRDIKVRLTENADRMRELPAAAAWVSQHMKYSVQAVEYVFFDQAKQQTWNEEGRRGLKELDSKLQKDPTLFEQVSEVRRIFSENSQLSRLYKSSIDGRQQYLQVLLEQDSVREYEKLSAEEKLASPLSYDDNVTAVKHLIKELASIDRSLLDSPQFTRQAARLGVYLNRREAPDAIHGPSASLRTGGSVNQHGGVSEILLSNGDRLSISAENALTREGQLVRESRSLVTLATRGGTEVVVNATPTWEFIKLTSVGSGEEVQFEQGGLSIVRKGNDRPIVHFTSTPEGLRLTYDVTHNGASLPGTFRFIDVNKSGTEIDLSELIKGNLVHDLIINTPRK